MLPIYLTEEEMGMLDRIGEGHRATVPPPGPTLRNTAEFSEFLGSVPDDYVRHLKRANCR